MKNKATWIVLSTSLLLLGWALLSRTTGENSVPESTHPSQTTPSEIIHTGQNHRDANTQNEERAKEAQLREIAKKVTRNFPTPIVASIGQGDARFQMRGRNSTTFFTPQGMSTAISNPSSRNRNRHFSPEEEESQEEEMEEGWAIHWELVGANDVEPEANGELPSKINYYTGKSTVTGLSTYSNLEYKEVYEGIDLIVESRNGGVKYTLEVAPKADPRIIRMRYRGAESIEANPDGKSLRIETGVGPVEENELYVYQKTTSGTFIEIPARYTNIQQATGDLTWEYSIHIGEYNPELPLIIDPQITFSTYAGGTSTDTINDECGFGIAVSGTDVFIVGETDTTDFPGTSAGSIYQSANAGTYENSSDAFISKINSSGTLLWSSYVGGGKDDEGRGVVVNDSNNPVIVGSAASNPTLASFTNGNLSNGKDIFVAEFSNTDGSLVWGKYIPVTNTQYARAIDRDSSGNLYVSGKSYVSGNSYDAFLAKLNSTGDLQWSDTIGGAATEEANGIAVNSGGTRIGITGITGYTTSTAFPTLNAPQSVYGDGSYDMFVAIYDGATTSYTNSMATYLGGAGSDYGKACDFDTTGDTLNIVGYSDSTTFAAVNTPFTTMNGSRDVLLAQYAYDSGSTTWNMAWSAFFGGSGSSEYGYDLITDGSGDIFIAGETYYSSSGTNIPASGSAFQQAAGSSYDGFVAKVAGDGSAVLWASYFGGNSSDEVHSITLSGTSLFMTGYTISSTFTSLTGSLAANKDAFFAKIASDGTSIDTASRYLGGEHSNANTESGSSIDTDDAGNIYLAGETNTDDFLTTMGVGPTFTPAPVQPNYGDGKSDVFVMKITSGLTLEWATYFGGDGAENAGYPGRPGNTILVSPGASPFIYVVGRTTSDHLSFPIVGSSTNLWQYKHSGGWDGFTAKFKSDGSILWSYFLGGYNTDYINAAALDSDGNLFVGGYTYSGGTTSNGIAGYTGANLAFDLFIHKLDSNDAAPLWTAPLVHGGDDQDYLFDIAFGNDSILSQSIYITGETKSDDTSANTFTVGPTPAWAGPTGGQDAFVGKITDNGTSGTVAWLQYLGGDENDYGEGVAADSSGNVYVTGRTYSDNMTITPSTLPWGTWGTGSNNLDGFYGRYTSAGQLTSFAYLGGSSYDYPYAIQFHNGSVYIAGRSQSDDFVGSGASSALYYDAFVTKISAGTIPSVEWTEFIGGSSTEYGYGLSIDSSGDIYLTGSTTSGPTSSTPFPTNSALSSGGTILNGSQDLFIAKLTPYSTSGSDPVIKLTETSTGSAITAYTFNVTAGTSPTPLDIKIGNAGAAGADTLDWEVAQQGTPVTWLNDVSPVTSGTLAVGSIPTDLQISVDIGGLSSGFSDTKTLEFTDAGYPSITKTIVITLNVTSTTPVITVSPTTGITWEDVEENSSPLPADQTVTITNGGDGTLTWTASSPTASWLNVDPLTDSVTTGFSTLTFSLQNLSTLPAGIYNDTITITDPTANPTSVDIPVSLEIVATGGFQTAPPASSDDKNPVSCFGAATRLSGNSLFPLALAFLSLGLLVMVRRKF